MKIGEAWLDIQAKVGRYVQNVNEAASKFEAFSERVKKKSEELRDASLVLAGASAAILVPMKKMISEGVEYGTSLDKIARITGESTEKFAGLRYAVESYHGSAGNLESGLMRLSRAMYDYGVRGLQAYGEAFDGMGISVKESNGKLRSVVDVFMDMAGYMENAEDTTRATGELMTLLGRGAIGLVPIMMKGKDAIAAQMEEAKRLGLVISDDLSAALEDLGTQQAETKSAMKALGTTLAIEVAPLLIKINAIIKEMIGRIANATPTVKKLYTWLPLTAGVLLGILGSLTTIGFLLPKLVIGGKAAIAMVTALWGVLSKLRIGLAIIPSVGAGFITWLGPGILIAALAGAIIWMDKIIKKFDDLTKAQEEWTAGTAKAVDKFIADRAAIQKAVEEGYGDMEVSYKLHGEQFKSTASQLLEWMKKLDPKALGGGKYKVEIDVGALRLNILEASKAESEYQKARWDFLVDTNQVMKMEQIKHYQGELLMLKKSGQDKTKEYLDIQGKIIKLQGEISEEAKKAAEEALDAEYKKSQKSFEMRQKDIESLAEEVAVAKETYGMESDEYLNMKNKIIAMRESLTTDIIKESAKEVSEEILVRSGLLSWIENFNAVVVESAKTAKMELLRLEKGEYEFRKQVAEDEFRDRLAKGVDILTNERLLAAELKKIGEDEQKDKTERQRTELDKEWDVIENSKDLSDMQKIEYLKGMRDKLDKGSELWDEYDKKITALSKAQNMTRLQDIKTFVDAVSGAAGKWVVEFLKGGVTIRNVLKGLWNDILSAFNDMVAKMIAKWMTVTIFKTAAKLVPGLGFLTDLLAEGGRVSGYARHSTMRSSQDIIASLLGAKRAATGTYGQGLSLVGEGDEDEAIVSGSHLARLSPDSYVLPISKLMAYMKGDLGLSNVVQGAIGGNVRGGGVVGSDGGSSMVNHFDLRGAVLGIDKTGVMETLVENLIEPAQRSLKKQRVGI